MSFGSRVEDVTHNVFDHGEYLDRVTNEDDTAAVLDEIRWLRNRIGSGLIPIGLVNS